MELIWFALASYGMTQILCYGKVFDFMRPDYYFFHCPMCIGFWVGGFLFGINGLTELFSFDYNFVNFFICGWSGSAISYIMCSIFNDNGFQMSINSPGGIENG
jgi:hypothetical protein